MLEVIDVSNCEDNHIARQSWERNARFWDERMGEGNDFVNVLEWPAIERLFRRCSCALRDGLFSQSCIRASTTHPAS
jgi:hypothetical protein